MKIGVENKSKDIEIIFKILGKNIGEEVRLEKILEEMLDRNVSSSDVLFLLLQKLKRDGYLEGRKGVIKVVKPIEKEERVKIKKEIERRINRIKKLFVTPLEVAKFYQCPRRFWLEKVVLSRQFKERRGKVWDGEVIHLAVKLFASQLGKKKIQECIENAAEEALKKYEGKTELEKEKLVEFLKKFNEFLHEEKFVRVFPEKMIESFKIGLSGSPDLIGIKENGEIIAIDIKAGEMRRGIKKEHLLQNIGESILVENYFRKKVNECYLIYFESDSLVKIKISRDMKDEFLKYKKLIGKFVASRRIPPKSRLPNYRKRVCQGCHVKPACDNIEILRKFRKI